MLRFKIVISLVSRLRVFRLGYNTVRLIKKDRLCQIKIRIMAGRYLITLIFLFIFCFECDYAKLQDEGLTIPELIKFWGYPVESHDVVTKDGYILTAHRIPHGQKSPSGGDKKPRPIVFLQHGLLCSSSNWVMNLPHQSLGFILADAGFDVWMGNLRGNTYSKTHQKHSTNSWDFWQFSFEEHANYDLPAMVDYALNTTSQESLYYVGHSMGTMIAFAKLSEDKEFQKKIKLFFALAPVAKLRHMYGPLELMANFEYTFKFIFNIFSIRNFLPSAASVQWFAKLACPFNQQLCHRITFVTSSHGLNNFNETRQQVYLDHTPAGTSVKNMYHFMQLVQQEKFQKYDYGVWKNIVVYKKSRPDEYDLTEIKNKVVIFYGNNDWLSHPKDVDWLSKKLPNLIEKKLIHKYNHLDFVWGLNAKKKIYNKVVNMINQSEDKYVTKKDSRL